MRTEFYFAFLIFSINLECWDGMHVLLRTIGQGAIAEVFTQDICVSIMLECLPSFRKMFLDQYININSVYKLSVSVNYNNYPELTIIMFVWGRCLLSYKFFFFFFLVILLTLGHGL